MPEFTLTAPPPSCNAMFRNRTSRDKREGKQFGRFVTKEYAAWRRGELNALLAQRARPVPWPVHIAIHLPLACRMDIDNAIKPIIDLLGNAGVIPDDGPRYVHKVTVERGTMQETRVRVESAECPV